jgi:sugar/nucleoside kinase (ribokinase family)
MHPDVRFDYTTVGHVTADVMSDGSRQPGGGAFYSALQAARLGQRTLILTQGVPREIEELLEPHRGEFELRIIATEHTTTLHTSGVGAARSQRVLAWAGPIDDSQAIDTAILHLAPVARETPRTWSGSAGFVGLTPQGLARAWPGQGGQVSLAPPDPGRIPERVQAMALSELERESCETLISTATRAGAIVAITDGGSPTTILHHGEEPLLVEVPPVAQCSDDLGAGDVFSAAFFIALAEGLAPRAATEFATAAAAVRIGGRGAQAIGGRDAIESRLRAVA